MQWSPADLDDEALQRLQVVVGAVVDDGIAQVVVVDLGQRHAWRVGGWVGGTWGEREIQREERERREGACVCVCMCVHVSVSARVRL